MAMQDHVQGIIYVLQTNDMQFFTQLASLSWNAVAPDRVCTQSMG